MAYDVGASGGGTGRPSGRLAYPSAVTIAALLKTGDVNFDLRHGERVPSSVLIKLLGRRGRGDLLAGTFAEPPAALEPPTHSSA